MPNAQDSMDGAFDNLRHAERTRRDNLSLYTAQTAEAQAAGRYYLPDHGIYQRMRDDEERAAAALRTFGDAFCSKADY